MITETSAERFGMPFAKHSRRIRDHCAKCVAPRQSAADEQVRDSVQPEQRRIQFRPTAGQVSTTGREFDARAARNARAVTGATISH